MTDLDFEHQASPFRSAGEDDLHAAIVGEESLSVKPPNVDINVSVDQKRPGRIMRGAKTVFIIGGLCAIGYGGYRLWEMFHGQDATHGYAAEMSQKETKVFKRVYLNLAEFDSEFHLHQETTLDRSDDALIDWNPFDYNTEIDTDITTDVRAGLIVERLAATRDDTTKSMQVVIDGDLTTTTPAVDWDTNKIDVSLQRFSVGVGTGEINKARHSAEQLVQAAGGLAASCALRDNDVQDMLGQSVEDFLASTSFSDGIDPKNITVTINNLDRKADAVYGHMMGEYSSTLHKIKDRYDTSKGHQFKVKSRNLTNCDRQKITIVRDKAAKR
jgi:hypothetical protein